MRVPYLNAPNGTRDVIDAFGGIDRRPRIAESSFREMDNVTSDFYPAIGPRNGKRTWDAGEHDPLSISGDNSGLLYVSVKERGEIQPEGGGDPIHTVVYEARDERNRQAFVTDQMVDPDDVDEFPSESIWAVIFRTTLPTGYQLIRMGDYIVAPGINAWCKPTHATFIGQPYRSGKIRFAWDGNDDQVTISLCRADGSGYDTAPSAQETAPDTPSDGALWIDTSVTPHVLKQYSATYSMWQSIATSYVRITNRDMVQALIDYGAKDGDTVMMFGIPETAEQLYEFNGEHIALTRIISPDSIVVAGLIDENLTVDSFSLMVDLPFMDHMIESGNRLWGCRYGYANNGQYVNEIYASALGNFRQWYRFQGVSTDSWTGSVGASGPFTGAINFSGTPVFFKEGTAYLVTGGYPSQYQIQTVSVDGVESGSAGSLVEMDHLLWYKSPNGIKVFDGATERNISEALGDLNLGKAYSACGYNGKYYVCLQEIVDDSWRTRLMAYDTRTSAWTCEGISGQKEILAEHMTIYKNALIAVGKTAEGEAYFAQINGGDSVLLNDKEPDGDDTDDFEWKLESAEFGMTTPDAKTLTRINVRMQLAAGSRASFYVEYDSTGPWNHVATVVGSSLRTFSLPILPRRCDHFRLRIVGKGKGKIYSIAKTLESGSELP